MQPGEDVFSVFFYGSNNSDSVVSGNAAFREIKDHSLRMTPFPKKKKKKKDYGSFGLVSTLHKTWIP